MTRAIESGARAYLPKNTGRGELRRVLADLVEHGFHHSELVNRSLSETSNGSTPGRIDWKRVPPREWEYCKHLLSTKDPTYEQIAERMGVSVAAVDGYFRWFSRHYGTRSRADLVRLILLSPPTPAEH